MATPSARSPSATLICFTGVIPACCSRRTRSCRPIAIAARSTARNRNAPTRANIESATGNASARLEQKHFPPKRKSGNPYAAFVFEPRMQGAAGMIPQPAGWLKRVTDIARGHGALLIADEVMTGFGRTGGARDADDRDQLRNPQIVLFACHHEGVQPDFLCLAKGLTGGYLPMAATLTTQNDFRRISRPVRGVQDLFPRPQLTPPINSARRRRWPAWKFCTAKNHPRTPGARKNFARGTANALGIAEGRRHPAGGVDGGS